MAANFNIQKLVEQNVKKQQVRKRKRDIPKKQLILVTISYNLIIIHLTGN